MRAAVNSLRSCGESNSWNSWRSSCYWPRIPWRSGAATKGMNETTDEHRRTRSSPAATKTMVHRALWSAAACCRLCSCGVAQPPERREQACALQRGRPKNVGKILAQIAFAPGICHLSLVIGHLEETADLALGPSPLDKTSLF